MHSFPYATSAEPELAGAVITGQVKSLSLERFANGLKSTLLAHGHPVLAEGEGAPRLAIHFTSADRPRPFRRKAQGTFVVSVVEVQEHPDQILKVAYPLLVRSLSNLLIYLVTRGDNDWDTYFITLEQGYYHAGIHPRSGPTYYRSVYERLRPLATSQLVINNRFVPDLPEPLWQGNGRTRSLQDAGQRLDQMNLLPAAFPIQEMLPARDFAHVKRLFGIGGLSYGNLSVREDATSFWMSASGVNKGALQTVGRDMLLIRDYMPAKRAMVISIPPGVQPHRASVDAIEHWMLYREHPGIGAIIHIHAWMDGIACTSVNYPCGTAELAREVSDLVRKSPNPSRAVIGLKNHGLTITGPTLEEIFTRIEGKLIPQVPMS